MKVKLNHDVVMLDNTAVFGHENNSSNDQLKDSNVTDLGLVVVKLHKPPGIECTSSLYAHDNIISYLKEKMRKEGASCSCSEKRVQLQKLMSTRLVTIGTSYYSVMLDVLNRNPDIMSTMHYRKIGQTHDWFDSAH